MCVGILYRVGLVVSLGCAEWVWCGQSGSGW